MRGTHEDHVVSILVRATGRIQSQSPKNRLPFFPIIHMTRGFRLPSNLLQVRRIWAEYYTCSDVRETTECLGVFLNEATRALDAGLSPGEINVRLKAKLIENAQRLDYHLDGDDPMVLYRLWLRWVIFVVTDAGTGDFLGTDSFACMLVKCSGGEIIEILILRRVRECLLPCSICPLSHDSVGCTLGGS